MFKGVMTLGIIAVLVLGGCSIFKNPVPCSQPQTIKEDAEPEEDAEPWDEHMQIAQQVPGFGGMFLDEKDNSILYVYLLDPTQQELAQKVITDLLGTDYFPMPIREFRVLQGQYSYLQLHEWNDRLVQFLTVPGVTGVGIDIVKNRLGIDLEDLSERSAVEAVEATLDRLGIPREAVILEERARPVLKC